MVEERTVLVLAVKSMSDGIRITGVIASRSGVLDSELSLTAQTLSAALLSG